MNFLRKVGTNLTFAWNPKLAGRADMVPVSEKEATRLRAKKKAEDRARVVDINFSFSEGAEEVVEELSLEERVDAMDEAELMAKGAELKIVLQDSWKLSTKKKKVYEAMQLVADFSESDGSEAAAEPSPHERVAALDENGLANLAEELALSLDDMTMEEKQQTVLNALVVIESQDDVD